MKIEVQYSDKWKKISTISRERQFAISGKVSKGQSSSNIIIKIDTSNSIDKFLTFQEAIQISLFLNR